MTRYEYNLKIIDILKKDNNFIEIINKYDDICSDVEFLDSIEYIIKEFPQQRFSQIICNYICSDYRDFEVSKSTQDIMEYLFPGNSDPFFEESENTLKRFEKFEN